MKIGIIHNLSDKVYVDKKKRKKRNKTKSIVAYPGETDTCGIIQKHAVDKRKNKQMQRK